MATYDDGIIYDDGTKYLSTEGVPFEYSVEREVKCQRVSVIIHYRPTLIPGADEAFRVHNIRLRISVQGASEFTHQAFIDGTTPSERLSPIVRHRGSEFIISNIQLTAQIKKHQPKG